MPLETYMKGFPIAGCRAAKQMDTLTKEVAVPLGIYMKGSPLVCCSRSTTLPLLVAGQLSRWIL